MFVEFLNQEYLFLCVLHRLEVLDMIFGDRSTFKLQTTVRWESELVTSTIDSLNSLILCCSAQVISNGGFPDELNKRLLLDFNFHF
jgi:hypothetical protein